jgi:plastocyanin
LTPISARFLYGVITMLRIRSGIAVCLLALVLAACTTSAAAPTPAVSIDPDAVRVAARDMRFDQATLAAPGGQPFTLAFDNQESLPHNVAILDTSGATVFSGQVFTGPALRTETVPALAAGSYTFICAVHPEMKGSINAS